MICSRRRRGLLSTSGHIQALAITGILAACSPTLPSETPLGRGPAAEKEKPERIETGDKRAPEGGATAKTEPSLSSHPAARPAPAPKPATAKPSATPGQTKRADERSIFFAGQYSGLYDAIIALQGHPEKKRIDPKAKIRVERVSDTRARLVLLESETENLYCTLDVEVSANQGTISTGQSWSGPPALGEITGNIITGTARVDARRLLVDLTADVEANVVGDRIGGRLKFHFHGWRPLE